MTAEPILDADEEGRLMSRILAQAEERPEAEALICDADRLDWADLRARVLHLAGALNRRLGTHGKRVALVGDTNHRLVVAYLAIVASGRCAVPLQTSVRADALGGMIANCDPSLVLFSAVHGEAVAAALPAGADAVCLDDDRFSRFLDTAEPLPAPVAAAPHAPFNIIYSSGTTGSPKGIVQSHAMRYRQTARGLFGFSPWSTTLLATPIYSNTTLLPLLATLFHGGRVVLMGKFDAEAYLDLAETHGATHTMLVPVQYRRILDAESFGRRDLSRFEVKQSTGAPLSVADKRRIAAEWPGRMVEVYGLTEGGCSCLLDVTNFPDKLATVGRPQPGNDIRIIDEDGNDMPVGVRGEVIGRSGMMMSGYFRNPEATQAFYWHDRDGTLYHRTGDIGVFDADGFLTLVDRKKDMIISGGFNVYASDLEEVLLTHPDISEAAVIGVPSQKWGETPLGLVIPRSGASPEPTDLLAWANDRLGKMQRLHAIELRPELPRSAVGKVLKQELKRPYWEDKQ